MTPEGKSPPYALEALKAIAEVAALSPLGLVTDVDGTIAEIAPTPDEARVAPGCRRALEALTHRLALVAAISGRPAAQARQMVGVAGMVYVGNHGLERWRQGRVEVPEAAQGYRERVRQALQGLRPIFSKAGVFFEDKGLGFSLHYRLSPDPEGTRQAILKAIAGTGAAGMQVLEGRRVVEVRPATGIDKGTALLNLAQEYGLRVVIYLGDDVTDIDAFAALYRPGLPFRGLALAVMGEETPPRLVAEADYLLRGVADVERFLGWLAQSRPGPAGPRTGDRASG